MVDGADEMRCGRPPVEARCCLQDPVSLPSSQRLRIFPGLRDSNRPMSNNALTAALRRMGYTEDEMTWHGFRSLASTALSEQGFPPDVIELQLAHRGRNEVRAAYNKAQRLDERRKMMQSWADYLDQLKTDTAKG